jgi:hypothetical protein
VAFAFRIFYHSTQFEAFEEWKNGISFPDPVPKDA